MSRRKTAAPEGAAKFREETSNAATWKTKPLHRAIWSRGAILQGPYLLCTFGDGLSTGMVPVRGGTLFIPGSTGGG